ncbi:MAG: 4Fe-4S binding protein [Fibrobacterota bacterium]
MRRAIYTGTILLFLSCAAWGFYFQDVFPDYDFEDVEAVENDGIVLYSVQAEDEEFYIFPTEQVPGKAHGYGGPLELYLLLQPDMTLVDIALAEHRETPGFIRRVFEKEGFNRHFSGICSPGDIDTIDIVSGATLTCEAVNQRVIQSLAFLNKEEVLSQAFPVTEVILFLLLAAVVCGVVFYRSIPRKFLLFAVLGVFFLITRQHQISLGVLYSVVWSPVFTFLTLFYLAIIVLSFVFGRFYCGFICPFGILQEMIGSAARRMKKNHADSNDTLKKLELIAPVYLGVLVLLLLFFKQDFIQFEILNYYAAVLYTPSVVLAGLTLVILFLSFVRNRFFCRFICPTGFMLSRIRGVAPFRTRIPDECVNCAQCSGNCPTGAIVGDRKTGIRIDTRHCIDCRNCLKSCGVLRKSRANKLKGNNSKRNS